jgi:hypothetical protein|tara:strand:- start:14646 stop:14768 length:123 start_codon:yes stop_codon:yes gene_type:complete
VEVGKWHAGCSDDGFKVTIGDSGKPGIGKHKHVNAESTPK